MAFKINVDMSKLRMQEAVPTKQQRAWIMNEFALQTVQRIKLRVRKGVDLDGRAFMPYSRKYAEYKNKVQGSVKTRAGDQGRFLRLTGAMLKGLQVLMADPYKFIVGFSGMHLARRPRTPNMYKRRKKGESMPAGNKSNALIAYYNQTGRAPRKFVGLTVAEKQRVHRSVIRKARAKFGWK